MPCSDFCKSSLQSAASHTPPLITRVVIMVVYNSHALSDPPDPSFVACCDLRRRLPTTSTCSQHRAVFSRWDSEFGRRRPIWISSEGFCGGQTREREVQPAADLRNTGLWCLAMLRPHSAVNWHEEPPNHGVSPKRPSSSSF